MVTGEVLVLNNAVAFIVVTIVGSCDDYVAPFVQTAQRERRLDIIKLLIIQWTHAICKNA